LSPISTASAGFLAGENRAATIRVPFLAGFPNHIEPLGTTGIQDLRQIILHPPGSVRQFSAVPPFFYV
jgi:hypothetical protein